MHSQPLPHQSLTARIVTIIDALFCKTSKYKNHIHTNVGIVAFKMFHMDLLNLYTSFDVDVLGFYQNFHKNVDNFFVWTSGHTAKDKIEDKNEIAIYCLIILFCLVKTPHFVLL